MLREWRMPLILLWVVLLAGSDSSVAQRAPNPESSAALVGCSLPGIAAGTRPLRGEELLAAYNAQSEVVRSLQASVIVRGQSGAEYKVRPHGAQALPAMVSFQAPAYLRMTGVVPFSARRSFDLASDGRELRLLVPDGKLMRFLIGPADAPATSKNPRENLRPRPLVDALHWPSAIALLPGGAKPQEAGEHQSVEVGLEPAMRGEARAARLDFDLQTGTLAAITISDASKQILSDIRYGDWRTVPGADRSVCYPRRVELTQPGQDLHLDLKIVAMQLNVPMSRMQFRLPPPRGIPVTRLSRPEPGNSR
jgi:hypothetical protein